MNTQILNIQEVTVCYLWRKTNGHEEICLAWKPEDSSAQLGLARKWNGYGGHVDKVDGSIIEYGAVRELREESGIVVLPKDIEKVAEIIFERKYDATKNRRCHFYIVRKPYADPRATQGMMKPTWFPVFALPYREMLETDQFFLPDIVNGKKVKGSMLLNEDRAVIGVDLAIVEEL